MAPLPITIVVAHGLLSLAAAGLDQPPAIEPPILGAIQDAPLTIEGRGFGTPGPDARLIVRFQDGGRLVVPSSAPAIVAWEDERIVIAIDDASRSGSLRVQTAEGLSQPARLEVYAYDWFDIPPTPGTNAVPLSIAVGGDGVVWVNEEFHRAFQRFDPAEGEVTGMPIPMPPDPGPFATMLFGDRRTQTSTLGEDIIVDPQGRVWFTQGGGSLYSGQFPNHSRIVCFDPDAAPADAYRIYNMPGDWNEIIGLAWDEPRGRMWVAQGSLEKGSYIASFDPERIPWDNDFDFSESLMHQVCEDGGPYDDCYRLYRVPNAKGHVAHLEVDRRGLVWFSEYWGNAIGVLEPESGRILEFPLPKAIGKGDPVWVVGSGPWQIVETPDGDIAFCEFFDSTIGRFDVSRLLDPACRAIDPQTGRNPCIEEWIVPNANLEHEAVHSIAFDARGRLWYSVHGSKEVSMPASVGFITADWQHMVRLPSLADFPADAFATCDGIAIDPTTGDIYFCEFLRQRIGRLQLVE